MSISWPDEEPLESADVDDGGEILRCDGCRKIFAAEALQTADDNEQICDACAKRRSVIVAGWPSTVAESKSTPHLDARAACNAACDAADAAWVASDAAVRVANDADAACDAADAAVRVASAAARAATITAANANAAYRAALAAALTPVTP